MVQSLGLPTLQKTGPILSVVETVDPRAVAVTSFQIPELGMLTSVMLVAVTMSVAVSTENLVG